MKLTYFIPFTFTVLNIAYSSPGIGQADSVTAWPRHTIDDSSTGADGVKLADWNQDGLLDIVTGWEEGALTRLYLHPGQTQVRDKWSQMTVGQTPAVEDAVFVKLEKTEPQAVLSCSEGKTRALFIHWPSINEKDQVEWQQASIPQAKNAMQWMYAIPFSLDTNTATIVAAGKGKGAAIGWFELPEDPKQVDRWIWHPIGQIGWIMSIIPADMDEDGDLDLLLSDRRGSLQGCRWLENPGSRHWKSPWTSHWIGAQGKEVMFIDWVDLDQDGDQEVLALDWTDAQLSLFSATSPLTPHSEWTSTNYPLPIDMTHPKSVAAGDLNGDGNLDLVISSNTHGAAKNGLVWLDGKKLGPACQSHYQSISGAHNAKYDKVELLDVDQDGDLDILICEENYGADSQGLGVIWYENQLKVQGK